jgi:hypothetical protein
MLCSASSTYQAPFLLYIYYMAPWTLVPVFSYSNFAVIRLVVIVHNKVEDIRNGHPLYKQNLAILNLLSALALHYK